MCKRYSLSLSFFLSSFCLACYFFSCVLVHGSHQHVIPVRTLRYLNKDGDEHHHDLVRLQAYPTPAQALDNATFMGNAPSSALQVIVRAFSAADRDQSQAVNAMRIFELREKEREEVRRSTILKRALNRMLRQAITETFEAWADLVKNEGGKRNVMTRILLRMTNKCVSGAFERWVENMVEHQTLRAKSNRVLVRWKNQSCAMCLDAWTSHTKEEIHKRNRMKQMLMKMFKREMSSAFENWVARMEEIKEAQAEEQRKQECMKRIAMRMVNMGLVMCLEAWAEYTAEESRKRALLKRMVLRMTGSIVNRYVPLIESLS